MTLASPKQVMNMAFVTVFFVNEAVFVVVLLKYRWISC